MTLLSVGPVEMVMKLHVITVNTVSLSYSLVCHLVLQNTGFVFFKCSKSWKDVLEVLMRLHC